MSKTPMKRIEYKGKHVRASRTGGVAVRASAHSKTTGTGVTINSKHGLRVHQRLGRGMRIGLQNGNTQFIGRWRLGRLNINASKSGLSSSVSNSFGSYNFLKPRYSSFKMAGIQIRGKNAAALQVVVMIGLLFVNLIKFGFLFITWAWWAIITLSLWIVDVVRGFARGVRQEDEDSEPSKGEEN